MVLLLNSNMLKCLIIFVNNLLYNLLRKFQDAILTYNEGLRDSYFDGLHAYFQQVYTVFFDVAFDSNSCN